MISTGPINCWHECERDRKCSSLVKTRPKIGPKLPRFVFLERRRPINSVDELRHLQHVTATTTCAVLARPGKRGHWIISQREKVVILQDACTDPIRAPAPGPNVGEAPATGQTLVAPPGRFSGPSDRAAQRAASPFLAVPRVHRPHLATHRNPHEPSADPDLAICTVK